MKTDIEFLIIINVMPQLTKTEQKSLKTSASPSVFLLFVKISVSLHLYSNSNSVSCNKVLNLLSCKPADWLLARCE